MNKKGSALLLSLLVVSAILSSILYISALSLRQISQSVNTDNALVAFYAAESGNEQAIYKINKHAYSDISELQVNDQYMLFSNSSFDREVFDAMYGINTGIYQDQFFQVDMFDSEDLTYQSNLDYLELYWEDDCSGDSWVEFTSNDWDSGSFINWSIGIDQSHIKKSLLNNPPVLIDEVAGVSFETTKSYQFRLKALYCNLYNLRLVAYDSSGQIIPFKNIFNIKSIGEYPSGSIRANKQALSVSLRKFSPLSGLFDYVIFSEKSLVKDIGAYSEGWFSEDLFITTVSLSDGVLENYYIDHLNAINGSPDYHWSLVSGTLPEGIEIMEDGTITGNIIGGEGIYFFRVSVIDDLGNSAEKNLQINVVK